MDIFSEKMMDQILRKSQKTLAVEAKRDFWSIFWKPHAQTTREIHAERILRVEKTGYHKLQNLGLHLQQITKFLRSCWRRLTGRAEKLLAKVDLQHRSCWRRLTGAPKLLARLTGITEVAGEGLPGAPKWLAKLDLICASRRIIACSIQSH